MEIMNKVFIAFLFLFITMVAHGQNKQSDSTSSLKSTEWKTLDVATYSILYPSTWELNQSGQMGTAFIILSPQETSQDQFRENVNLIIQDISAYNIDFDEYVRISEDQLKKVITNSTIIESKRIKIGQIEYHRLIHTGDQGIFHLKFEQHLWIKNKKAYVLTLTCEQDRFADYKEIGDKILNSFTLKQ